MTKIFGRVKLESEETNIWLKRKQKRKRFVSEIRDYNEEKIREVRKSLPGFLYPVWKNFKN